MKPLEPGDPASVGNGRYQLTHRLGQGGMGVVYLGRSPSGRAVAVKVVRPELSTEPGFRRRFADEVAAARLVGGFHTAPVVDADPDADPAWLVTAFVPGPTLATVLARVRALPVDTLTVLAAGLAEALEAIHRAGVIHRDFKPANIIIAEDGPRVIDFGIARALDGTALTQTGYQVGTPGFLAPEQLTGGTITPAVDMFALGVVLVQAAGGSPFGDGPSASRHFRVVYEQPDLSAVPEELYALVTECLSKDPAGRPSPGDFLLRLAVRHPEGDGWLPDAATALLPRPGLVPGLAPVPVPEPAPGAEPAAVAADPAEAAVPTPAVVPGQSAAPAPVTEAAPVAEPAPTPTPTPVTEADPASSQPASPSPSPAPPSDASPSPSPAPSPSPGPGSAAVPSRPAPRRGVITEGVPGPSVTPALPSPARPEAGPPDSPTVTSPPVPGTPLPGTPLPGTLLPGTLLPGTPLPGTTDSAAPAEPARRRRGLAAVAAAALALSVLGLVLWQPWSSGSPDGKGETTGGSSPGPSTSPVPAAFPTQPLLIRRDTGPGWPQDCKGDIATRGPAGTPPVVLISGSTCDMLPQWAPERLSFAFTRTDANGSSVWVAAADGSEPRRITSIAGGRVAWSPDGKYLAVLRKVNGVQQLWRVDVADGKAVQLTSGKGQVEDPAWSPNGKRIAVSIDLGDGDFQIHTVDPILPGAPPVQITQLPHPALDAVWSPDGSTFAYTASVSAPEAGSAPQGNIHLIGSNGAGDRPLVSTPDHEMDPAWSPDGQWLAFVRGPYEKPVVWAVRADGTDARALTAEGSSEGHPGWR
ncbi:protein kinase [Streptomyces sp. NPDC048603]|uniref:protein kinase domain-containing protein n=1 Tax=Streptomyces sp. NPDC048603 TaxID=3365577 RepID=UPI003711256C